MHQCCAYEPRPPLMEVLRYSTSNAINTLWNNVRFLPGTATYVHVQGYFQGGGICPPPLGYAENSILLNSSLYKSFNDTINGNLCLCEKVPDSTKLCLIKGPKSKLPREACPRIPPSLPHALHKDTYLPP